MSHNQIHNLTGSDHTVDTGSAGMLVGVNSSGASLNYYALQGSNSAVVVRSGTSIFISVVTSAAGAGGGSGTVTAGTAGNLAYYAAAGTAVDDLLIGSAHTILGVNSSEASHTYYAILASNNAQVTKSGTSIFISALTATMAVPQGVVTAGTAGNLAFYAVSGTAVDDLLIGSAHTVLGVNSSGASHTYYALLASNNAVVTKVGTSLFITANTADISGKQNSIAIPLIVESGGTGRTTIGSAHTILGVNSSEAFLTYYALVASNNAQVTKVGTSIFITALTNASGTAQGVVTAGTAGNLAYYAAAGTAVDDLLIGSAHTILGVNSSGASHTYYVIQASNNATVTKVGTSIFISGNTGSGDITDVGDVATGAAFTGSAGSVLTFLSTNTARLLYSGTHLIINRPFMAQNNDTLVGGVANPAVILRNQPISNSAGQGVAQWFETNDSSGGPLTIVSMEAYTQSILLDSENATFQLNVLSAGTLFQSFLSQFGTSAYNHFGFEGHDMDFLVDTRDVIDFFRIDGATATATFGNADLTGLLNVHGRSDQTQLLVEGHTVQSQDMVVFRNAAASPVWSLRSDGTATQAGHLIISPLTAGRVVVVGAAGSISNLAVMNSGFLIVGSATTARPHVLPIGSQGQVLTVNTAVIGALAWANTGAGGSSGSGVVTAGSAGNLAYYATAGTAVDDLLIGSANTIVGVNSSGASHEYKVFVGGANVTVTFANTSITIAATTGGPGTGTVNPGSAGNIGYYAMNGTEIEDALVSVTTGNGTPPFNVSIFTSNAASPANGDIWLRASNNTLYLFSMTNNVNYYVALNS